MAYDDLCEICEIETPDNSEMSVVARGLPAMITISKKREDGMWKYWQNVNNITVHTRCYVDYMDTTNIIAPVKRKLQEPVEDLVPNTKKHRVSAEVTVKSGTNCLFCGRICGEAVGYKKSSARRRAIVTVPRNSRLREDIKKSINLTDDDWAAAVYERIKDKDSLCGLKYHSRCRNKFLYHRKKKKKQRQRRQSEVSEYVEAMEKIYDLIDTSGEYQYSLEDLRKIAACDISTNYLKDKLEKKYGNDIIFSSLSPRKTVVTLKCYEDQILSKYYETENPKSDTNRHIIKNAAQIICEDIQATLFDSSTYPLIAHILDGVGEIIPESLKTFLDGIILKQKKSVSHEMYSKKIQSIAYTIMANTL